MNKVTIKKIPFMLKGDIINPGAKLNFSAENLDSSTFELAKINGVKILSTFPDINTKICDAQTQEIAKLASQHPKINFISISTDSPEKQAKWCAAHNLENISIVSDKKSGEFAKATNLYIPKIKKLHRALIVLDKENIIQSVLTNTEVAKAPDYKALSEWISKLQ